MTYYFDTNILVTAHRYDFPLATSQEFWDWLVELGEAGTIRFPEVVFEELGRGKMDEGKDPLAEWATQHRDLFIAPMVEALPSMPVVLDAYEKPMQTATLEKIQNDACVIAHAHALIQTATIVSYETPNQEIAGHKKKIPSVCAALNVKIGRAHV